MNGSYLQHSMDTTEFLCGSQSKLDETFNIKESVNPHPSATKEWLDWQLGYDSCVAETMNGNMTSGLFVNPFLVEEYWNSYGFRI